MGKYSRIKDSGTRTEFQTGAVRDGRSDKGRYDLLPLFAMRELALHFERGALKYTTDKVVDLNEFLNVARSRCTCRRKESLNAILNCFTTLVEGAGTATSEILESEIRAMLKDRERIAGSGSGTTSVGSMRAIEDTRQGRRSPGRKEAEPFSNDLLGLDYLLMHTISLWKSKVGSVPFVVETLDPEDLTSIMTTKQEEPGDSFVPDVIKALDCWEIAKRELDEHSDTCNILQLKLSMSGKRIRAHLTGDRNWEKGIPVSKYIDSAQRHLEKFKMGLEDEPHLIASIWNLMCARDTQIRIELGLLPQELDDLPYPLNHVAEDAVKKVFGEWI